MDKMEWIAYPVVLLIAIAMGLYESLERLVLWTDRKLSKSELDITER